VFLFYRKSEKIFNLTAIEPIQVTDARVFGLFMIQNQLFGEANKPGQGKLHLFFCRSV
jgi:hypothetical protein